MQNLTSLLLTILGIVLFITLLPALLWLFLILILVVVVYFVVQRARYRKYMEQMQDEFTKNFSQEDTFYENKQNQHRPNQDDVIDVEFSESEEEES